MVRNLDGLVAWARALPVPHIYTAVELGAMALAAGAAAHFLWTTVTPVGAYGDWRIEGPRGFDRVRDMAALAQFDPFNRGAPAGGTDVVTALPVKLFGISVNSAAGTGSAIIETSDGVQTSFATGDEVMPGVTLKSVAIDHVTITRGGVEELLYIDQSEPVENAEAPPPDAPAEAAGVTLDALAASIRVTPRVQDGRTTGLVLSAADPAQLAAAGFQEGDIVTRVNGAPVTSVEELLERASTPRSDGMAIFTVERGGTVQAVRTRIAR